MKKLAIFFILYLLMVNNGNAQQAPVNVSNELQEILESALPNTFEKAGGIMRVTVPGSWTWSSETGFAISGMTAGQDETIAIHDMQFRIGSITKTIVATCVMKLEQDGLISIDDPIDNYLRATMINDTIASSGTITIRQLLNHTSGVANSADNNSCQQNVLTDPSASYTFEDAVYCGGIQGEIAEPGLLWAYSNTNYTLLAMIIEAVTGQSYQTFVTETIITPLGLNNTEVLPSNQINNPHMGCYWNIGQWIDLTVINSTTYAGWADIVSTTEDLITFYSALLNGQLINATQLARMQTIDAASYDYGMGLDYYNANGSNYFGHFGEVANTSGLFFVEMQSDLAPNGYYISYNFNVQGVSSASLINAPVINVMSQTLGIHEDKLSGFNIYPNPTHQKVNIQFSEKINSTSVKVIDLRGNLMTQQDVITPTSAIDLNLQQLAAGIYFIQIENLPVQRLIIE